MSDTPETPKTPSRMFANPVRRVASGTFNPARRTDRLSFLDKRSATKAAEAIQDRESHAYEASALEDLTTRNDREEVVLDEAQQNAVSMMLENQYAIIGGYAGTGKTTLMAQALEQLRHQTSQIDFTSYRTFGKATGEMRPSIGLFCFANVAARNLASKLPEEWAPHCMSIHSGLAFAPISEHEDIDPTARNAGRFEPRYTETNPLPLDIVIIDEAGIVNKEVWDYLIAACQPTTRIYFLGDLAQLTPTGGTSPMPFAIKHWPHVILDTIYRQKEGGALLENITRVRRGLPPNHDAKFFRCGEKEILPSAPSQAQRYVTGYLNSLYKLNLWDPAQDVLITPTNEGTLGKDTWNTLFRYQFNPERLDDNGVSMNPLVLIRCGLDVLNFQVGDKVMATTNGNKLATERRFVNGSIGTIVRIEPNDAYAGDMDGLGERSLLEMSEVEDRDNATAADMYNFSEDAMNEVAGSADFHNDLVDDEDLARRQTSHIITVVEQATGEEFRLSRTAEVTSLRHAYAVTCHKFQGSQARNVLVLCHDSMTFGQHREWLYTACSRAKERVFLLHTPKALEKAIARQDLVGRNPVEKMEFLLERYAARKWAIPKLPAARRL